MGITIIWTTLKIVGFDMKHEELTSLLKIIPFDAHNKNDLLTIGKKKIRQVIAEHSFWALRSDSSLETEASGDYEEMFEAHINNILEKILPVKDKFLEVTKNCDAWIEITMEINEWHSYIELSRKTTKQLSEFNLYAHFDLHYMGDEIDKEN